MFPATTSSRKERMAESISQTDLDALWGSIIRRRNQGALSREKGDACQAGLSQADLDALWGDLGGARRP